MISKIKFLEPGMITTIQDNGIKHKQHIGISKGGAAIQSLIKIGNALVDNKDHWSIEFIYKGPKIKIEEGQCIVSISGNVDFDITKNQINEKGKCFRSYLLNKNDEININHTIQSVYGYISFGGSLKLKKIFNSLSCNPRSKIGSNEGSKIKKNDILEIENNNNIKEYKLGIEPEIPITKTIRVLEGPQFNYFSKKSIKEFFKENYEVTNNTDKMGMRLLGKKIENIVSSNIKSEAIIKGAIQVPADGQPIILLTDHQTIGGYPKIAVVISADIEILSQIIPKNKIKFKKVNLKEAYVSLDIKNKIINKIINSKIKVNE